MNSAAEPGELLIPAETDANGPARGIRPNNCDVPASNARDPVPWLLAGICAIALVAALYFTRTTNPLNSDTPSYLYFDPSRTIGYPVFLWIVRALAGNAVYAVQAQMALLAASLFWLGLSFYRVVGRPKLSLLLQLLLVASPELWHSSAELMTEALATASVALWCAELLRLTKRGAEHRYYLLAMIAAAGTLVRPSQAVLYAATALAALLLKAGRKRWIAQLAIIPIALATWMLTPLTCLFIHGSTATGSPFARGVLQHTLFCEQPAQVRDPDAAFVEQESKTVRDYIESAPVDIRTGLEHLYSAQMRFRSIIPLLGRAHHLTAAWQTDPILMRIAIQRLKANPICYGRDVLDSYFGLITQGSVHSKASARRTNAFLGAHPPVRIQSEPLLPDNARALLAATSELHVPLLPAQGLAAPHMSGTGSPLLLILGRFLFGAAAAVGLVSLILLVARPKMDREAWRLTICVAALGLAFHALFAGTAIVELALIRYTVPAWPITCALLVLAYVALPDLRPIRAFRSQTRLSTPTATRTGEEQPIRVHRKSHGFPPIGRISHGIPRKPIESRAVLGYQQRL